MSSVKDPFKLRKATKRSESSHLALMLDQKGTFFY